MSDNNKYPIIKNWIMVSKGTPYNSILQESDRFVSFCISGDVYNHPTFADGEFISTSIIVGGTTRQIETISGSIYILEEPNNSFLAVFPDCIEILRKCLCNLCDSSKA